MFEEVIEESNPLKSIFVSGKRGLQDQAQAKAKAKHNLRNFALAVPKVLVSEQLTCAPRIPLIFLVKREQALLLVDFAVLEVAVTTD
jgi:hypothetical protein